MNASITRSLPCRRMAGCWATRPSFGTIRFYSQGTTDADLRLRLKTDLKTAMRAKETIRVNVVKTILSDITYAEKAAASTAPVSISTLIQRAIKKRGDSVVQFRASGRDDLAEKEQAEIGLLEQYLPKQMSKEDVEKAVREIVDQVGAKGPKDMGAVMKQVAAKIDDSVAPKKLVAEVVKSVLQSL